MWGSGGILGDLEGLSGFWGDLVGSGGDLRVSCGDLGRGAWGIWGVAGSGANETVSRVAGGWGSSLAGCLCGVPGGSHNIIKPDWSVGSGGEGWDRKEEVGWGCGRGSSNAISTLVWLALPLPPFTSHFGCSTSHGFPMTLYISIFLSALMPPSVSCQPDGHPSRVHPYAYSLGLQPTPPRPLLFGTMCRQQRRDYADGAAPHHVPPPSPLVQPLVPRPPQCRPPIHVMWPRVVLPPKILALAPPRIVLPPSRPSLAQSRNAPPPRTPIPEMPEVVGPWWWSCATTECWWPTLDAQVTEVQAEHAEAEYAAAVIEGSSRAMVVENIEGSSSSTSANDAAEGSSRGMVVDSIEGSSSSTANAAEGSSWAQSAAPPQQLAIYTAQQHVVCEDQNVQSAAPPQQQETYDAPTTCETPAAQRLVAYFEGPVPAWYKRLCDRNGISVIENQRVQYDPVTEPLLHAIMDWLDKMETGVRNQEQVGLPDL